MNRKVLSGITAIVLLLILVAAYTTYHKENNTQSTVYLKELENELIGKGYRYTLQEAKRDFLPAARKRILLEDNVLDIYLFSSEKKMEQAAKNISPDGCGYKSNLKAIQVSWVSYPHFYKKGGLIVQYVGEDNSFLTELEAILGTQFAGAPR